jgi:hypothetical protein
MATRIGVVVSIAVTFLLSGLKILNEYERSVFFARDAWYHTALGCVHGSAVRLLLQREA